jgi:hypothetical protein
VVPFLVILLQLEGPHFTKHESRESYLLSIRNFPGKTYELTLEFGLDDVQQPDVDDGITSTLYGAVSFQPQE